MTKKQKSVYNKNHYQKNRKKSLENHAIFRSINKEIINAYAKKARLKLREVIFNHYGMRCVGCPEDRFLCLTIDHINDDGSKHRKETGSGVNFYRWLKKKKFPPGFQVLCHNCNWMKYTEKRLKS